MQLLYYFTIEVSAITQEVLFASPLIAKHNKWLRHLLSTILIMKPILEFPAPKALETPKLVFWKRCKAALSKIFLVWVWAQSAVRDLHKIAEPKNNVAG